MKILQIAFVCIFISSQFVCLSQKSNIKPLLNNLNIADVIASMTLEEKASLLLGAGLSSQAPITQDGIIGDVKGKVQGATGSTNPLPQYGIPEIIMSDGPAGLRIDPIRANDSIKTYYATAWPVGLLLASTWDTCLVSKVSKALGNEAKEYGVDALLAPGMNLIRDPLNGRNFEYYSEDPLLSGKIGSAYVNGVQANNMGCSVKHFVANNQESNRLNVNVNVSERALREMYLRGFEIAIKESYPWLVMSSYNKVNGEYTPESYELLMTILRKEWGYNGCVITDWGGGRDDVQQMRAGNDLIMPGADIKRQAIIEAVKNGSLDEKVLDRNLENILKFTVKTPAFKNYNFSDSPDLDGHAELARMAAAEGVVLLKNNNKTLPLVPQNKLVLFGCASYDTFSGGTGSGEVYSRYRVSIIVGMRKAGYEINTQLENRYYNHIEQDKVDFPRPKKTLGKVRITPELPLRDEQIEKVATESDIAIYTIGRQAGEGRDIDIEGGFNLDSIEYNQIKRIANIFHAKNKRLVVIINSGAPIETASWKNIADAIILPWLPGQEAGNAIADVLSGKTNPSGKLTVTFPMKYEDLSTSINFPGVPSRRPKQVTYEEGIYVGYRYMNSFQVKPSFSFGYGLSYTQFEYSKLKLSSSVFNNEIIADVKITNTGKVAGKEIVQLYIAAPKVTIDKPEEELKSFAKTKLLQPGESQILHFSLNTKDLASFYTEQSSWIADAGKYIVKIGASSTDIRQEKAFSLNNKIVVEKLSSSMSPIINIEEIKAPF